MSYIEENGYFIFDGIKSSDYGVWIHGGGTYNAPKRRYQDYVIPGRNGTLTIDEGVFEEIEVVYPAFIARDFPSNIEAFRNELMSRSGYVRMTDSYHPDEYYLAKYMDGLDADVAPGGVGAQFNLTFKRDPRRFLVSGETPITIGEWGETETASGEIVSVELEEGQAFKSVVADINPVQSGSGDPSPDNVRPITGHTSATVTRTGKNLIPYPYYEHTHTESGITWTDNGDGTITANGTATATSYFSFWHRLQGKFPNIVAGQRYILSLEVQNGTCSVFFQHTVGTTNKGEFAVRNVSDGYAEVEFTAWEDEYNGNNLALYIGTALGQQVNTIIKPMIRLASETDDTYEPYVGNTYPITFPSSAGTVYGGYVDAVNGKLVVDRVEVDLGTKTWTRRNTSNGHFRFTAEANIYIPTSTSEIPDIICSVYPTITPAESWLGTFGISCNTSAAQILVSDEQYATAGDFRTAMEGVQAVYKLATPIEYDLTPTQIAALVGTNNIWADTGDVTVEYGDDPNVIKNPTLFDSKPLIRVTFTNVAENLIKTPYPYGSFTQSGIKWTENADGTVTAEGTATARSWYTCVARSSAMHIPEGTYRFTCAPNDGSSSTYNACIWFQNEAGTQVGAFWEYGNGVDVTITSELANAYCIVQAYVESGVTAAQTVFTPLLVSTGEMWCQLDVGDESIRLLNRYPHIDVDCDLQDCYYGTTNANQQVIVEDFPALDPGVNGVNMGIGIEKVEITPRWYRV